MTDGRNHIVFAMLHESGHLNPSFKLARALSARGHRVSYLTVPEAEPLLAAQGFETLPLYPELFPRGFVERDLGLSTFARRRAITQRYEALLERLSSEPSSLLSSRPDLMLIDVTQPQLAFWARRTGQPFIYLNTSLPQTHDRGVPPLRSARPYERGLGGTLRAELDWLRFLAKRRVSAAAAGVLGMGPPYDLARKLAKRFDVPAHELDWQTAYMPQLRGVPELVSCPEAFDYPRAPAPARRSIGSVDLERREAPFDFAPIPEDKPLVYCALGGQRYRPGDVPGFFVRLVRAFEDAPHRHLLLSIGKHVAREALGTLPANVTVVEHAPQLAVLRRARLMVTHAGLGSVKECVLHGVPMLAVPLDVDQPANAARIVYHGLGAQADVANSTAHELATRIDTSLSDGALTARVAAMRARFLAVEQGTEGVDLVEARLARPG